MKLNFTRIITLLFISSMMWACGGTSKSNHENNNDSTDTATEDTNTEAIEIDKAAMAEKVKTEFLHSWNAYKEFAWGHDALKPLSKSYRDWYPESLLMTPVDAFDTMILMGLDKEAEECKQLIFEKLSFDKDITVQNFEITIRLLGGLLSAYQFDGDQRFLNLAKDLGDRLLPVFETETGIPYTLVNLKTGQVDASKEFNNPAEIGTLLLEFGTLSKLTGNPVYYDKAKKALTALYKTRSEIDLVGTLVNIKTGEWTEKRSHISGMIDSYYEYLLKAWLLFKDEECKEMWETSIKALNTYVADTADSGFWYSHVDMDTGERVATQFGALDAFMPALLALGGDLDRAKSLMESCYMMWTKYGIEPEQLDYEKMEVLSKNYFLRPENIESAYYLYHYTKDPKYLEMGKTMFESIVEHCRTEHGYAALKDMISKEQEDAMESFFLAETLKYAYLLFAPEETLDFESIVFNTEAHPLKNTWD